MNFLCFKTLEIRAWIGRNAFVFAAQTSDRTQSAILKKILSGISFAKINKNCPELFVKVDFIGYRKVKEPIRDSFTKQHPHDVSIGSPNEP